MKEGPGPRAQAPPLPVAHLVPNISHSMYVVPDAAKVVLFSEWVIRDAG